MDTLSDLIAAFCLVWGCNVAPVVVPEETKVSPIYNEQPSPIISETSISYPRSIPKKARRYLSLVKKIAKNPSREAALTEQESAWNAKARSPYAKGLRQFTDSTGKWMAKTRCKHLGSYRPYDTNWSLRCGIIYIESLQRPLKYRGSDYCFNRSVAERLYNGGGSVKKELRRAGVDNFKEAKKHCRRAGWACEENYQYAPRIAKKQPKYASLGGKVCPAQK